MAFDYESTDAPDVETVAAVVADIIGHDKPPPLSDEETRTMAG
jgi:hypothetical protein